MRCTSKRCFGPESDSEWDKQLAGFDAIRELLDGAHTIAICGHTSPDGDALGSVLGLMEIIESVWPEAQVTPLLADDAPVPRIYEFMPRSEELIYGSSYTEDPDLFIAVDLSEMHRLNLAQDVCKRAKKVAILDHHPTNSPIESQGRVIRSSAAAAGVIITEFAMHVGADITASVAQNLMCAVMTDTGRFQYQNSDSEAFEVASLLVNCGASPSDISLNVY